MWQVPEKQLHCLLENSWSSGHPEELSRILKEALVGIDCGVWSQVIVINQLLVCVSQVQLSEQFLLANDAKISCTRGSEYVSTSTAWFAVNW